ncbi:two-component system sensor histidine kinase/response regulator [Pigmentiphaga litoralis]|uniref:PAS domain S-box protein n=1 Tax=Pigmentiphaga litoralis TaxID=516702 RepID=UPI00167228B3|nr:PAS domain S-box protein [Pigmentiphaga litoralis]GGX20408.1 two-component system sensor histidine kinase/response regulator [Pigmentiphaga litoralis]
MTDSLTPPSSSFPFLAQGGDVANIIATRDWSATPIGPIDTWPGTLTTTLALILRAPLPIVTLWGDAGVMLYNDAYSVFAGGRHPELLGSNVREGWAEIADFNDNVMKVGLAGKTLRYEDQELTLYRNGVGEPVWMNLDYSPIPGPDGVPVGVIAIVVETTAKVRAERWLSGERERLRRLFEQAPGFMAMLTGPTHVFDMANAAFMSLVGHRELLGSSIRDCMPELAGQGFFERLDQVYTLGRSDAGAAHPMHLTRTPGAATELRHVDFIYQPVRSEDGDVIGIFIQGTDVTDRLLAESAVAESEAKFRTFAQAMPNQVWSADSRGALDWFNDKVYAFSGRQPGTLGGNAWWHRALHPDDVPHALNRWQRAVETGGTFECEFRICRADGIYRWHLSRALPIRDAAGDIVRWVGSNTDIEDQKSAARALERLNKTLEQQVAESQADRDRMWRLSTDVMLVADFEANIVAINPAWTELLGWDANALVGRSFMDLVHPDDRIDTLAEVGDLSAGKRTFKFVNRYRCRDGHYVVLSWTAVPDARFIHAVGRDITADREAADALRRTELALQQSQKMETIGKLTGGVAHDFNNLLQVISGNLQLLATDVAGNGRAERRLANALGGVQRGAKLASQLLAFGRRQPLEPKTIKIGRLIGGMEDMLRRSLGEAVEIETLVSGGLWNTLVDPTQVENAILNLAINARDAMDGTGRLTLEAGNAFLDDAYARQHVEVTPGQYVMLAVTDTGCGMTPEVLAQAYEPFFSTKPEGKGTGLGLSMVYGFVKQSGGHIKIYSEPGMGTTVKLYLPRSHDVEEVGVVVETAAVEGGRETILVAEDDDQVRTTVVETLSELGYRVLKASDAASALAIIESGISIDVLFTDVVMPGPMRSPELARRARERLPGLAVLFTSGYTENSIVHGGRLDAGVDLLSKPYTREALARKIRQVLAAEGRRGAGSAGPPGTPAPLDDHRPATCARRILFVEDDALIRENTRELLQELGHTVFVAGNARDALATLSREAIDVLITDLGLPGESGEALAHAAKKGSPGLGIIFATGTEPDPLPSGFEVLRKPYDTVAIEAVLRRVR